MEFQSSEDDDLSMDSIMDSIPKVIHSEKEVTPPPRISTPTSRSFHNQTNKWNTPDDTIDLHGKTREEAIMMVQNFVMTGYLQKLDTLLIITGKGMRSGRGGPVLKQAVWQWLKKNGKSYIRTFSPAPPEHGGSGAIWIELL